MAKTKTEAKAVFATTNLDELREALEVEREDLIKQIKSLSSASLTSNRQAGEELADVGSDDFIRETELHLMTEEGKHLALINSALDNIENGTYGICADCSKPISIGRLKAKPYATLCIDCKSAREMNGGFAPDQT